MFTCRVCQATGSRERFVEWSTVKRRQGILSPWMSSTSSLEAERGRQTGLINARPASAGRCRAEGLFASAVVRLSMPHPTARGDVPVGDVGDSSGSSTRAGVSRSESSEVQ